MAKKNKQISTREHLVGILENNNFDPQGLIKRDDGTAQTFFEKLEAAMMGALDEIEEAVEEAKDE
jgi:hypothetical protein